MERRRLAASTKKVIGAVLFERLSSDVPDIAPRIIVPRASPTDALASLLIEGMKFEVSLCTFLSLFIHQLNAS